MNELPAVLLVVAGLAFVPLMAAAQQSAGDDVFIEQVASSEDGSEGDASTTARTVEGDAPTVLMRTFWCPGTPRFGCGLHDPLDGRESSGGNIARITQSGDGNRASVVQRGSRSSVNIRMTGGDNSFTALQDGNQSLIQSEVDGSGVSLTVEQFGNRLRYIDDFDFGRSGLEGHVTQKGENLSLVQRGVWLKGFRIEQTGIGTGIPVNVAFGNCLGTALCSVRP